MKSSDYYPIHNNGIIRIKLEENSSDKMNYQNNIPIKQNNLNQFHPPYNKSNISLSTSDGNVNRFPAVILPDKNVLQNYYNDNQHISAIPHQQYYNISSALPSTNSSDKCSINNQCISNQQKIISSNNTLQGCSNFLASGGVCDTNQLSLSRSNRDAYLTPPIETPYINQLSSSFNNLSMNPNISKTQFNSNGVAHLPNGGYQSAISIQCDNNTYCKSSTNLANFNSSSQSLPQSCLNSSYSTNENLSSIHPKISINSNTLAPNQSDSKKTSFVPSGARPGSLLPSNNPNNLSPSRRMINVMEERLLIPTTGIMNPVPNIMHISKKPNCNPNIMRSTLNVIPCNEDILGKIRLPLAILIHPFKDLADLQVIRSKKIVRCRTASCRMYLNPFVTFLDQRRWKCNLCQRVNELTDELLDDDSIDTGIDSQKRAEVRLATVEYIAPREYSSYKTVQAPIYVFVVDLNAHGNCSLILGALNRILTTIDELLERFPGYQEARFSLIGFDSRIHLYPVSGKYRELVLSDIAQPIELPINTGLVVSIRENRDQIQELLASLLDNVEIAPSDTVNGTVQNCLGSALLVAKQLIENCGGRITIFNASCPSIGEGTLRVRESKQYQTTFPITPDREFYKSFSLECTQAHIGVDLFQLGRQPCDLASLSIVSRYCGGSLFYYPDLTVGRIRKTRETVGESDIAVLEIQRLLYDLNRYLTRKIGFDAVLRVRHSPGFSVHSCHGNMYKRACDMFSMATVNPDSGLAVRLEMTDGPLDAKAVFFQVALLYTSSVGERRIRVHTLCLPVSSQIDVVFRSADHQALAGFLAKSVSDRVQGDGRVLDTREALINAIVDPSRAFGEFCLSSSQRLTSLPFPYHLRLLPLLVWGLLQSSALSPTNHRSDSSVAVLDHWRNAPLSALLIDIYPSLYDITSLSCFPGGQHVNRTHCVPESTDQSDSCSTADELASNIDGVEASFSSEESEVSSWDSDVAAGSGISCYQRGRYPRQPDTEETPGRQVDSDESDDGFWCPEQLHLTAHSLTRSRTYLLDSTSGLILLMGADSPRTIFQHLFGVNELSDLSTHSNIALPDLTNAASVQLRLFIRDLQITRPTSSHLFVITKGSSHLNSLFQQHLIEDDRLDSSYQRFLNFVQRKINK